MRLFYVVALFFSIANYTMAQSVKVMSYNIRLDTEADGVNQWKNRSNKVVALIKKYNPDLFGVQEALHNQMMDLQNNLPEYAFVGVGRDDGKEKGEYSAIFYKKDKFDVLKQNTFWLSETPEVPGSKSWDAAITRVVTWALLKDKSSGKSFTYFNTHFDHIGKEARVKSAALIKKQIAELSVNDNLPILVSGDFNSEPSEIPYQTMILSDTMPVFDSRPAKDITGTFCGFEVGKITCRTIDYVFHSSHWKAKKYKVIQDHDGKYYPSDHLPVLVTLSLK
ncbi:MAG TPA: endonuclease/exonuclease/phosphatase family protein [Cyclobacteriaceae bacterium]|nr:endonuclease/exonuclease/phosphatase family protein [Cyclobacteriaceae bacterium]HPW63204.1 endonuclease/exonuclease/phosphatase family protein [Cyclobacteriaceae bacterium]